MYGAYYFIPDSTITAAIEAIKAKFPDYEFRDGNYAAEVISVTEDVLEFTLSLQTTS